MTEIETYTYVAKAKKSINLFLYLQQKVQRYVQLKFLLVSI